MSNDKKITLDENGEFMVWKRLAEFAGKVEWQGGQAGTSAIIPGVDFGSMLKPYVTQKVRIKIEVLSE